MPLLHSKGTPHTAFGLFPSLSFSSRKRVCAFLSGQLSLLARVSKRPSETSEGGWKQGSSYAHGESWGRGTSPASQ